MIIVLSSRATKENVEEVVERLKKRGYKTHISEGVERTVVGAIGVGDAEKPLLVEQLEALSFVEKVILILKPYKLVAKDFKPERTVIKLNNGVTIGDKKIVIIAGPCAVEGEKQLMEVAYQVKKNGASILRGGAYKPRTSPYAFQGLQEEGLKILAKAREETGLLIITELMDPRNIDLLCEYSDIIQIGARNMQNFFLLKEVGRIKKPILLKRGMSATIEELLMAAEYIMSEGNYNVILCERGIRTFENYTRNTLDLNMVPSVKELSHLPIIVDPSHGTGRWKLVNAMSKAALACGADGLMIEVHPNPAEALSDGPQSLTPENFAKLMQELKPIAEAVGKTI